MEAEATRVKRASEGHVIVTYNVLLRKMDGVKLPTVSWSPYTAVVVCLCFRQNFCSFVAAQCSNKADSHAQPLI